MKRFDYNQMKKLIFAFLLAVTIVSCSDTPLRVGTYNLWRSDLGNDEYAWTVRKHRLIESIRNIGYDLFAAQEVDTTMIRELPVLFEEAGLEYEIFIFSPYREDGGTGNKAQAVIYDPRRLVMLEDHHFWFSLTPDRMSSGWDEPKFKRGACCFVFQDKWTGRKFFFMASHMPLGKEANTHAASIINERARMYNPDNLPALFTGDLNTRPDTPSSETLRSCWTDVYYALPKENRSGPHGTFNSHNVAKDMEAAQRIDYIYYKGDEIKPLSYCCDTTLYDGLYPSDHCPVYADIQILN